MLNGRWWLRLEKLDHSAISLAATLFASTTPRRTVKPLLIGSRLRVARLTCPGTNWHTAGDFSSPTPAGGGLPLGRRVPSDTRTRPLADFDVKYIDKGNDLIHKLQVFNRGTSTAYGVSLSLPEGSALSLRDSTEIEKIPGGKSVTVDVFNDTKTMAVGPKKRAFDITVEGRTETGEVVSQQVFIDVNG